MRPSKDEARNCGKSWIERKQADHPECLRSLTDYELGLLSLKWECHARPSQSPPEGDWNGWLIIAGRGWGKTRVGAEYIRAAAESGWAKRIGLVGETSADGRDVMVEGESGILAISDPRSNPLYEPSKQRLTWPNGTIATLYDACKPDQLRGPQHDLIWFDELAKYSSAERVFDMAMFGLRLGTRPRWIATTTPRSIPLIKRLLNQADVRLTRGKSDENVANLAASFRSNVIERYRGTRLGRQELDAEILEDVPGALWTRGMIDETRIGAAPELTRIVVGVDPAASSGENANETGIIVAGLARDGHAYVVEDCSLHGSPDAWARRAVSAYRQWAADCLVAEAWPEIVRRERERNGRPCLTMNLLEPFIRQVVNDARQNQPAIKVHAADSVADPKTAEIYNGLIRNIETTSRADVAYDTALDFAVTMGFGYFRINTEYAHDDSFDLDLKIRRIINPFSVYADPYSTESDSSDWNSCFVTELIEKDQFRSRYKNAEEADWDAEGYSQLEDPWRDNDRIMVAEYFTREQVRKTILLLSDQSVAAEEVYLANKDTYDAAGIDVIAERESQGWRVTQRIMTGAEVLETNKWAGQFIPIVPVYGVEVNVEGRRHFRGLVRPAKARSGCSITGARLQPSWWRWRRKRLSSAGAASSPPMRRNGRRPMSRTTPSWNMTIRTARGRRSGRHSPEFPRAHCRRR